MPWEADGRNVAHAGPRRPQGRSRAAGMAAFWPASSIAFMKLGEFSETNWNDRSVVEISALKKSDGWFFHAITGEAWLLKLKFRVYRGTFKRDDLRRADQAENAQRTGRTADLRQRAAGESQNDARPVAGSGNPRAYARRNRHARILVVSGRSRHRLLQVYRESRRQAARHFAMESARTEVALPPQRFSAWKIGRSGMRKCSKSYAKCCKTSPPRANSSGTTSSLSTCIVPAAARAVGDDAQPKSRTRSHCT